MLFYGILGIIEKTKVVYKKKRREGNKKKNKTQQLYIAEETFILKFVTFTSFFFFLGEETKRISLSLLDIIAYRLLLLFTKFFLVKHLFAQSKEARFSYYSCSTIFVIFVQKKKKKT